MPVDPDLAAAARLLKVLGHESRLWLVQLLGAEPRSVGDLVEATGMSQPLVSQHLRTLRDTGLVTFTRQGKELEYRLTDDHVTHVVGDAVTHAREQHRPD